MKCQDIQFELSLYFDDILAPGEIEAVDSHLATCPLCRERLSGFQAVRNDLRAVQRFVPSDALLDSVRSAVRSVLVPPLPSPEFRLLNEKRRWMETWLIPSAVGSFATLVFALTLLWVILLPVSSNEMAVTPNGTSTVFLASTNTDIVNGIDLSPLEYANTRLSVAGESPSINPHGALIALSRSLVRGEMKDEEVVIVADVFGDGLAQIAEVVEPPQSEAQILELRKAFQSIDFAPFVPASMDRRSESVRVVFKIQSVNVRADSSGL
jgi:Predicted transmembrane transcriptional regulator (anti-sigma factor)